MNEADPAAWKWVVEHVAIPLLGGLWSGLALWVTNLGNKLRRMTEKQAADDAALHNRITTMQQVIADTYSRRDDVREGFQRIETKLDIILKHQLRDSQ